MVENITPVTRSDNAPRYLEWSPIVLGALAATALSSVLLGFGATIGLGISSTAPTWRDASAALAILSGLYLILQAMLSFGLGGYLAGRLRASEHCCQGAWRIRWSRKPSGPMVSMA